MFENTDRHLKGLAKWIFVIAIFALIYSVIQIITMKSKAGSYLSSKEEADITSWIIYIIIEVSCIIFSFVLHGLGMIVENTRATKESLEKLLKAKGISTDEEIEAELEELSSTENNTD